MCEEKRLQRSKIGNAYKEEVVEKRGLLTVTGLHRCRVCVDGVVRAGVPLVVWDCRRWRRKMMLFAAAALFL